MQLFPGVVFNNDQSDDLIVRGGNLIENLYMVIRRPLSEVTFGLSSTTQRFRMRIRTLSNYRL
ncbi:hypothetical protein [Acidobacterium sp. S8]|uniref:hypothetical protein n=1 Tax=Acidobacterium sp. S8 TaxID=1641854 RepID=UPI00131C933A|nr:hypothetical protein [Acidobacterium sp. S8]